MNLVNLESVSHAYGPKPLLGEVSLGIEAGDRIGVVGRNGDGKTTLISVIAGTVRPRRRAGDPYAGPARRLPVAGR